MLACGSVQVASSQAFGRLQELFLRLEDLLVEFGPRASSVEVALRNVSPFFSQGAQQEKQYALS